MRAVAGEAVVATGNPGRGRRAPAASYRNSSTMNRK